MKQHMRKDSQVVKCHYCDFMTNDSTEYLSHVGDVHSPKFNCGTCSEVFTDDKKRIEHTMTVHAFNYSTEKKTLEAYECFDCGEKLQDKQLLMSHKTEKHYKTRLCSYFHGNMSTCRFPAHQCINIHNENIRPTEAAADYRSRIICNNGNACVFLKKPGGCHYKHVNSVETHPSEWQRQKSIRENTLVTPGIAPSVERGQQPIAIAANTSTPDMTQIVLQLSKQMENISQKLAILELKSRSDFPTLAEGQRRS